MKYLIVEDNFGDVDLLKLELKAIGCEVMIVEPSDALQNNREHKPEVVQLDGLDGACFWFYQEMRQENPDAVFLLFSARRELYDRARNSGLRVFDKGSGSSSLLDYVRQLSHR